MHYFFLQLKCVEQYGDEIYMTFHGKYILNSDGQFCYDGLLINHLLPSGSDVTVRGKSSRLYQPWQISTVQRLLGKTATLASSSGLTFSKLKESAARLSNWQVPGSVKKSHHRSAGHHDADSRGRSFASGKVSSVRDAATGASSSLSTRSLLSTSSLSRSSLLLGAHLSSGRPVLQSQKYTSSDWKKPGAYRCPSCGKLYRWKKNLISHRRLECGKEPQLQCPYCPHRTKHKSSLVKHVDRLHGQPCPQ